jgi:large subunit ribosomal protein L7/L12
MAKMSTDDLLDAFKEMTLLELSEFVKQFEEAFDVKAAAPVAVAAAGGGAGAAEAEAPEEQDEFDVILEAAGDKKIQVIKEVRSLTAWASRRRRTWSTARPRPCLRRSTRKPRRRARRPSRALAPPSPSSSRKAALGKLERARARRGPARASPHLVARGPGLMRDTPGRQHRGNLLSGRNNVIPSRVLAYT